MKHTVKSGVANCIDDMEIEVNDINVHSFSETIMIICELKLRQKRETILVDRYF